jgi:hypothetical protein
MDQHGHRWQCVIVGIVARKSFQCRLGCRRIAALQLFQHVIA